MKKKYYTNNDDHKINIYCCLPPRKKSCDCQW